MPVVARPIDPRIHLQPWLRPWLRPALLGVLTTISLAGCPSPPPRPTDAARTEPTPTPAVQAPAPLAPRDPTKPALPTEPMVEPAATPAADLGLPGALAAPGVRPMVQSTWRALEAVDGGDADALAPLMLPTARWFPPGSPAESVGGRAEMQRAMNPWSSAEVDLDVRRVIDLGGSFAVQLAASAKTGDPPARHELLLVLEVHDDRIAVVRHYGDPLGPVRLGPDATEPLDLGPVGEVVLEQGQPNPSSAFVAKALTEALDQRKDAAAQALLAEDVVLHDVVARRTRRGREGYLAGYRATLGDSGHLVVDVEHSGPGLVIFEGAVQGREPDAETVQEFGFGDVHRVVDGAIVETWHYVNRRGRPSRPRTQP